MRSDRIISLVLFIAIVAAACVLVFQIIELKKTKSELREIEVQTYNSCVKMLSRTQTERNCTLREIDRFKKTSIEDSALTARHHKRWVIDYIEIYNIRCDDYNSRIEDLTIPKGKRPLPKMTHLNIPK